jgi:hypothetical protein
MVGTVVESIDLKVKPSISELISNVGGKKLIFLYEDKHTWGHDYYALNCANGSIKEETYSPGTDLDSDSSDCNPLYPDTILEPLKRIFAYSEKGYCITSHKNYEPYAEEATISENKIIIKLGDNKFYIINEFHDVEVYIVQNKTFSLDDSISLFKNKTRTEIDALQSIASQNLFSLSKVWLAEYLNACKSDLELSAFEISNIKLL